VFALPSSAVLKPAQAGLVQNQIEKYKNSLKDSENLIEFNKIAYR
jgi:hypothetical protein